MSIEHYFFLVSLLQNCTSDFDGKSMICTTPNMTGLLSPSSSEHLIFVGIRFEMDGVRSLWNFTETNVNLSRLGYTIDPELHLFDMDPVVFDTQLQDTLSIKVGLFIFVFQLPVMSHKLCYLISTNVSVYIFRFGCH